MIRSQIETAFLSFWRAVPHLTIEEAATKFAAHTPDVPRVVYEVIASPYRKPAEVVRLAAGVALAEAELSLFAALRSGAYAYVVIVRYNTALDDERVPSYNPLA